jgi:hypothetical protein
MYAFFLHTSFCLNHSAFQFTTFNNTKQLYKVEGFYSYVLHIPAVTSRIFRVNIFWSPYFPTFVFLPGQGTHFTNNLYNYSFVCLYDCYSVICKGELKVSIF